MKTRASSACKKGFLSRHEGPWLPCSSPARMSFNFKNLSDLAFSIIILIPYLKVHPFPTHMRKKGEKKTKYPKKKSSRKVDAQNTIVSTTKQST